MQSPRSQARRDTDHSHSAPELEDSAATTTQLPAKLRAQHTPKGQGTRPPEPALPTPTCSVALA